MDDSGIEKTMSKESLTKENIKQQNPEFNTSYPVQFQPASCKEIAEPLKKIVAFEVGLGLRSATNNADTYDSLERLQRSLMIGSSQENNVSIPLSENDIRFLEDRFNEYATAKALSNEEIFDQSAFLRMLREKLDRTINVPKFQDKRPDSFGVGSNSILGIWGRKRGEKGSKSGLG